VEILPADKQWYYIVNGETGEILNNQTYTLEQALGSCIVSGIKYKVVYMSQSEVGQYSYLLRLFADYIDYFEGKSLKEVPYQLEHLLKDIPLLLTQRLNLYVVDNNHIHAAQKYFEEQVETEDKLKIQQNKEKYKGLLKNGLSKLSEIFTSATIKSIKKRLD
jgi:hypothetical protein